MNGVDQGHLTGIRVPDYDGVRSIVVYPTTLRWLMRVHGSPSRT